MSCSQPERRGSASGTSGDPSPSVLERRSETTSQPNPSPPTDTVFLGRGQLVGQYVYSVSSKCLKSLVFQLRDRSRSMAPGLPYLVMPPDVRASRWRSHEAFQRGS